MLLNTPSNHFQFAVMCPKTSHSTNYSLFCHVFLRGGRFDSIMVFRPGSVLSVQMCWPEIPF